MAIDGVSSIDLQEATKAILRNSLGHGFFPSPPEFRGECDRIFQGRASDAARLMRQRELDEERRRFAKPVNHGDEARARVAASYAAFCVSHSAIKESERERTGQGAPEVNTPEEFMSKYGIDADAFAKIPVAKQDNWRTLK